MKIQIKVNGLPFVGARTPAFNAKCINESELGGYDLRFKECKAWLDVDAKEGSVDWLAQGTDSPNDDFDHELVHARLSLMAPYLAQQSIFASAVVVTTTK